MDERNSGGAAAAKSSDREIVAPPVFDAPRELVFEAWTDPRITQWWGPNGFATTTHEMDVRPGGGWHFVMHGPDGVDYNNRIVYLEIVKPERLAGLVAGGNIWRVGTVSQKGGRKARFRGVGVSILQGFARRKDRGSLG